MSVATKHTGHDVIKQVVQHGPGVSSCSAPAAPAFALYSASDLLLLNRGFRLQLCAEKTYIFAQHINQQLNYSALWSPLSDLLKQLSALVEL